MYVCTVSYIHTWVIYSVYITCTYVHQSITIIMFTTIIRIYIYKRHIMFVCIVSLVCKRVVGIIYIHNEALRVSPYLRCKDDLRLTFIHPHQFLGQIECRSGPARLR